MSKILETVRYNLLSATTKPIPISLILTIQLTALCTYVYPLMSTVAIWVQL